MNRSYGHPQPLPTLQSGVTPPAKQSSALSARGGLRGGQLGDICAHFPHITTRSPLMMRLLEEARKFACSQNCILIQGESGTGKELMAASVHRLSPRSGAKLVTMNCSAIPEGLLESELFGYVRGAFTGADRHKEGFFSLAQKGTLFLDEIGDMPLRLQAKLLRVLQNQSYHPVGSTELKKTDVRIIAATNIDLARAVQKKRFRLDLYYRLNILPIEMPPLRLRTEDIDLLVDELSRKANEASSCCCYFSAACRQRLRLYPWPGNIRELENLITRLIITKGEGIIDITDLPPRYLQEEFFPLRKGASYQDDALRLPPLLHQSYDEDPALSHLTAVESSTAPPRSYLLPELIPQISLPAAGLKLSSELKKLEEHLISKAMAMTGNNKNRAAALLGMKRTTLVEKMKRLRACAKTAPSGAAVEPRSSAVGQL